jgi:uncharacterized BrkB/YihY/UPF0761 family membrane protein
LSGETVSALPVSVWEQFSFLAFIGILIFLSIAFISMAVVAVAIVVNKHNIVEIVQAMLQSARVLQLFTVAAVVVALIILAVIGADRPVPDSFVTALSAIAGFVLGNLGGKGNAPPP